MMNIPYIAWGAELSSDYRERSRIVTWRMVAGSFGGILFLAAPFLLPFDTTEMNAQVLSAVAWGTLILVPVTVAITCFGVPSAAPVVAPPRTPFLSLMRSVLAQQAVPALPLRLHPGRDPARLLRHAAAHVPRLLPRHRRQVLAHHGGHRGGVVAGDAAVAAGREPLGQAPAVGAGA